MKTYQIPTTKVVLSLLRNNLCSVSPMDEGAGKEPGSSFPVPARKLYV